MTKTTYLFGEDVDPVVIETRNSVARYFIKKAKGQIHKLLIPPLFQRDEKRINASIKAKKHWEDILEEGL